MAISIGRIVGVRFVESVALPACFQLLKAAPVMARHVHVRDVLLLRPGVEVGRIDAAPIMASVQYGEPFGDRAVFEKI